MELAIIILLSINVILTGVLLFVLARKKESGVGEREIEEIVRRESDYQIKTLNGAINGINNATLNAVKMVADTQGASSEKFMNHIAQNAERQDKRQQEFMNNVETHLENMRTTIVRTLADVRQENAAELEKMRQVVEEKMQSTLTERLNASFALIGEQLDKVKEGLGEMRNLTEGVTDLKKVLGGVKTRGVWGEISLGSLIEEVLYSEQYVVNAQIGRKREAVEFAVVLPGKNEEKVLLPIDAKFPLEDYQRLVDASENGDKELITAMGAALERRIRDEAKTIAEKYVKPPETTDFAVMYLPIEGLFAEVTKRQGLLESIHAKYHVLIAGPTTLAALLNSLQVGFKTLAIQKRSREIWTLLASFRTEFTRFADLLEATQKHMDKAAEGIHSASDKTFQIQKKLSKVELIEEPGEES
ncbi:MAG: DNA recombination protein RmuC [Clostridia bacterium]|nr:DNA recombination protein RmuC [Clostridia bacterium]